MTGTPFWREVRAQAVAGSLVVSIAAILAGITYIAYTVPSQLDRVISNQTQFKERLDEVEKNVDSLQDRVTRVEAQR